MIRNRRKQGNLLGQGTIEYLVVFTVVLAAILSSGFLSRISDAFNIYFAAAAGEIVTTNAQPLVAITSTPPTTAPQLALGLPPLTPPTTPLPWQPPSTPLIIPPTVTTDPDIIAALNLLNSTELGAYYANLIIDHNIPIVFGRNLDNISSTTIVITSTTLGGNTISTISSISISLAYNYSLTADHAGMASMLAHEAVHADYAYNPQRWIDYLSRRHPEVSSNSIHHSSIDQEYNAVSLQVLTLQAIQGTPQLIEGTPQEYRRLLRHNLYYQGESYLKDYIRGLPSYMNLPEY